MALVTVKEILEIVGISRATLYRLLEEGLPYEVAGTKKKMFDPEKVKQFIAARKNELDQTLLVGNIYSNDEIVKIFKCGLMGGMRKSNTKNVLVLISFHYGLDRLYGDYWKDDILYYTGMGQIGDQSLDYAQNKTLKESNKTGITVYLFEAFSEQEYTYQGIVKLVGEPIAEKEKDANGDIRIVFRFPLKLISEGIPVSKKVLDDEEDNLEKTVSNVSERDVVKTATNYTHEVSVRKALTLTYERNPIITRYAKIRSKGICELCGAPAPFLKDGEPYLEAHHIVPLADGGKDSIDNISAVCPNCHRKLHVLNDEEDIKVLRENVDNDEWVIDHELAGRISLKRLVKCPHCLKLNRVDLENYASEFESDRPMGIGYDYSFSIDDFECDYCGDSFSIRGEIGEYPLGCLEYENIKVEV